MPKTILGPSALVEKLKNADGEPETQSEESPGLGPNDEQRAIGVGTVLKGKYELVKHIASGSMGKVYEARHLALQRKFAVKVLSIDSRKQADALPRFKREAELTSKLGHENIVDVVDIDSTEDDQWYIVMELLEGEELRDLMYRSKKLSLPEVVNIAYQLGSAVDAAHTEGVVHRDLKPENIFVLEGKKNEEIELKILDFGISKVRNADCDLTRPGEVIGTPFYMAPEQARGDSTIDHRADLFALGAVFYEALTGTAPFKGKTPNAVLKSILIDDLPPPKKKNPDLPQVVCDVLEKALAKERDDRYQSGAEMAKALKIAVEATEADEEQAEQTPEKVTEPEEAPREGPEEKPQSKSEANSDEKPESESEAESEPETEGDLEDEDDTEDEPESEPESDTESESESEDQADPEPSDENESVAEPPSIQVQGFKMIHLILAFVAGAILCAGIVALVLSSR